MRFAQGRLLELSARVRAAARVVTASLGASCHELRGRLSDVQQALRNEEATFVRTLDRGSEMLDLLISEAITDCTMLLTGDDVFTLHDTYGFPVELHARDRGRARRGGRFDRRASMRR